MKHRGVRICRRGLGCAAATWVCMALGQAPALASPPEPPPGSLKVVFFTDIHARTEWETPEALRRAAEAINAQEADLVLCGGDMITDGYISTPAAAEPRWAVYQAMHEAIRPTPVVVVGNHDLVGVEPADGSAPAEDPRAEVRARFNLPQTYRSFGFRGYHFILLDAIEVTPDEHKYRGWVDSEQMAWLRSDLAKVAAGTPVVVVSHMPLRTELFRGADGSGTPPPSRVVANADEVLAAFENHRLLAVLQGHLHVEEVLRRGDTAFITGGAVCGKWWRGSWHGTAEGFGVLHLHPDRVEWEYHTYPWEVRRPLDQ